MADWQISQDVEAAMVSAIESLPDFADELSITLHHDSIDVSATASDAVARRRCFPRRPFATFIVCSAEDDRRLSPV